MSSYNIWKVGDSGFGSSSNPILGDGFKEFCYLKVTTPDMTKNESISNNRDVSHTDETKQSILQSIFSIMDTSKFFTSNLFEKLNSGEEFKKDDIGDLRVEIDGDNNSYVEEDGKKVVCLKIDEYKLDANIINALVMAKGSGSDTESVHFENIDINDITNPNLQVKALTKLVKETFPTAPGKGRTLVLRVRFDDLTKSTTDFGSTTSSRMPDAKGTSAIKFAVAADHVKGKTFSSAKAVASLYSSEHPLVAAVMKLPDRASVGAVERVLDMAPTADHAVSEVEAAMAVAGSKSSEVLKHFPGGVATRMVDNDTTGAITAALAEVF